MQIGANGRLKSGTLVNNLKKNKNRFEKSRIISGLMKI